MPDFLNPVKGFGVTFRQMFRKVDTVEYPEEKRPTAPRFHGRHQLNRWPDGLEKCIGCELCAWACPADAIYVEGEDNTDEERYSPGERYGVVYQINYLRCILCGLCVEACPTRALTMTNEYEIADDSRENLIWTKEQLLAPLESGMEMPPHPMRLGDTERDYYGLGSAGVTVPRDQEDAGAPASPGLDPGRPGAGRPGAGRRGAGSPAGRGRERGGPVSAGHLLAAGQAPSTGASVTFWVLAVISVAAALGMVVARRAVHCAVLLAVVMLSLAILYAVAGAPFLALVQIIVYTGAVLMLFLFVLMIVGVSTADSLRETIPGQRLAAGLAGIAFLVLLTLIVGHAAIGPAAPTAAGYGVGNVRGLAILIFTRYVFPFEVTAALLITAALGAMVLAHRERTSPKPTQRDLSQQRVAGSHPSALPGPGVYARHNAADFPALLPDGSPSALSVSPIIAARERDLGAGPAAALPPGGDAANGTSSQPEDAGSEPEEARP